MIAALLVLGITGCLTWALMTNRPRPRWYAVDLQRAYTDGWPDEWLHYVTEFGRKSARLELAFRQLGLSARQASKALRQMGLTLEKMRLP